MTTAGRLGYCLDLESP